MGESKSACGLCFAETLESTRKKTYNRDDSKKRCHPVTGPLFAAKTKQNKERPARQRRAVSEESYGRNREHPETDRQSFPEYVSGEGTQR
jgi:hypothetical protein